MSRVIRITFAVCILVVVAGVAAHAQMPQPFSSDLSITTKNGTRIAGKWYFSAPKLRMDMTSMQGVSANSPMGGSMSVIVDGASQTTYILMTKLQMYMESHGAGGSDNPAMNTIDDLNRYRGDPCAGRAEATCKKIGTETVNGRSCDKWEVTDKNAGKSTVWIDQKLRFPIRVLGGDGSDVEFTSVKEGAQDASLFTLPPGYRPFDPHGFSKK